MNERTDINERNPIPPTKKPQPLMLWLGGGILTVLSIFILWAML